MTTDAVGSGKKLTHVSGDKVPLMLLRRPKIPTERVSFGNAVTLWLVLSTSLVKSAVVI